MTSPHLGPTSQLPFCPLCLCLPTLSRCSYVWDRHRSIDGMLTGHRPSEPQGYPKQASSPTEQKHNKKARTPSTEEEKEETDKMVRQSQEEHQRPERSQDCSKSRNHRRQRAKSQARVQVVKATSTRESFIPADTRIHGTRSCSSRLGGRRNRPARGPAGGEIERRGPLS